MTGHTHTAIVEGCYRCDLNKDELLHQQQEMRIEARALNDMADDFRHVGMTEAEELCREKADAILGDLV